MVRYNVTAKVVGQNIATFSPIFLAGIEGNMPSRFSRLRESPANTLLGHHNIDMKIKKGTQGEQVGIVPVGAGGMGPGGMLKRGDVAVDGDCMIMKEMLILAQPNVHLKEHAEAPGVCSQL
ncbi:hypothetical protein C5167_023790 [Papaver somniferum]|uniref:Uncharacterized protein n=1 Tax=Papaver somniferum TaxID=3469 RepID=A0A4Y7JQJ9_PAPSO|nr:hypothetical protein C5167_023790 [Papaver somniferum]